MGTHGPMDDRRIESLLRMALEAEDLEQAAIQPQLHLVRSVRSRRTWLLPLAAAMASAAAVLAIMTLVLPAMNPAPKAPEVVNKPTHQSPIEIPSDFNRPLKSHSTEVASAHDDEASVVLAFFEGMDGRCTCMHIQDEEWNSEQLAGKNRGELLDVAYRSKCGSPSPSLLVVAIAGRRDALPRTPEAAEALASCLTDHTRATKSELVNRAYQAVPGLPAGSMVVAETVGSRSTMMDYAKFSTR